MSIGKLSSEEVQLGEKAERMRLFKILGDMTMLELNLTRRGSPILRVGDIFVARHFSLFSPLSKQLRTVQ